jgi:uncharacterized protein
MIVLFDRRPVLWHFLISFLIASLVIAWAIFSMIRDPASAASLSNLFNSVYAGRGYINLVTILGAVPSDLNLLNVIVFASAPTIAAIILAAYGVNGGLGRLLARLLPIGPDGEMRRSLILYAGLIAIYFAGLFAFDWVAGPGVNAYPRLEGFGVPILIGALIGLFVDEGGTLEELGWRGFAWPALLAAMRSPVGAALMIGVIHWAWHLPREVITLMSGASVVTFLTAQTVFLILTIALAVVCGFCVNMTGGSVLPAIMVHGGTNVWSKAMGEYVAPSFGILDLRTLIVILLALILLAFARKRLGLKDV